MGRIGLIQGAAGGSCRTAESFRFQPRALLAVLSAWGERESNEADLIGRMHIQTEKPRC